MSAPEVRAVDVSEIVVRCDGNELRGGIALPEAPRGLLVLLHGIPSTAPPAPDDEGYPGFARTFAARGWAAAWAGMRGVRGSGGHFSIEGWVHDAGAILAAARAAIGSVLPAAYVGSSAGGAVASEAVRRGADVDALVLLAAPAAWVSFAAGAQAGVRRVTLEAGMSVAPETLSDPTAWADEFTRVATEMAVAHLEVPMLVVHGTADDVVPVEHAYQIARAAPDAELRVLDGAPHQLRRDPAIPDLVHEWLVRHMPRRERA